MAVLVQYCNSVADPVRVLSASIALYVLLGLTSLGVRWCTRDQASSQLRLQVDAWWWIFPVVSVALALYPLGLPLLALLIGVLAVRELRAFASRPHRRLAWLLLLLTASSVSVITAFSALSFDENTKLSWLFYLFVLTALNDIGQFVSGKLFGSARIAPTISPNKTWQGLLGGIAVSVIVSISLGGWLGLGTPARLAAYGAALSLCGFLGDLLFSGAKRTLGVKDFSNLIPGHGGILDRVDSLVLTAPVLYLLLNYH